MFKEKAHIGLAALFLVVFVPSPSLGQCSPTPGLFLTTVNFQANTTFTATPYSLTKTSTQIEVSQAGSVIYTHNTPSGFISRYFFYGTNNAYLMIQDAKTTSIDVTFKLKLVNLANFPPLEFPLLNRTYFVTQTPQLDVQPSAGNGQAVFSYIGRDSGALSQVEELKINCSTTGAALCSALPFHPTGQVIAEATATTVRIKEGGNIKAECPLPTPPNAVVPASLAFGNVTVNTPSTQSLNIQNSGSQPLQITNITSSSARFVPASTSLTVMGNGTALLNVTFTPNAATSFSATLSMDTNDSNKPTINVSLTGTGFLSPPSVVVPPSLSFGVIRVNNSSTQSLTFQNNGGQSLQVTNITSSSARFVPASTSLTVTGNGTALLNVTFTPNTETSFNPTLTANTNDPANPTISIALSGTGGLPHIQVSSSLISFGNVAVCLSATQNLLINNTGALALTVSAINLPSGPFSRSPASLTVPGGGNTNVQVTFTPTVVGAANATMTLVNDDPDPAKQNLQVTLSGNGTPSPPPVISVNPSSINFGATLVNFFIGKRVTVQNTSPCLALTYSANTTVTSGSVTFPVTTGTPVTVPPPGPVSGTVSAGNSESIVVVFAPTGTGTAQGTLTITSNDPANPSVTVNLEGTGVQATASSLSMVLDRSGSMAGSAPGGTKMGALKLSAKMFVNLLIEGQGDRLGTVEFDDVVSVLTPIADVTAAHKSTVETGIDTLTPRNLTSIGGGLQTALTQLSGATTPRKIIMVFTDGRENALPMIANVKPSIPSGTEVYSVGLGNPANISSAALSELAATTNGRFFNPEDALILRKDFVQVLSDAFRMNMAADPVYTISPRATHNLLVPLCECDHRASFVIYWDHPGAELGLVVIAPDGTTYTPTSPATNRLVRYLKRPGYAFYQIAFPPVDTAPGAIIGPPRIGYWQMRIKAISLPGGSERFSANVLVESDFELKTRVSFPVVGQSLTLSARLTVAGKPVRGARVVANVTQPLKGLGNILVQSGLREAELRQLPKEDRFGLSFRARAIRYLLKEAVRRGRPLIPTEQAKYQLFDDGKHGDHLSGDGIYAVVLPNLSVEGVYTVELKAQAGVCGGGPTRETTFSVFAPVVPSIKASELLVFPGPRPGVVSVTLKLRDPHGNFVGPGSANLIGAQIAPKDGQLDPIKDNLDGSYTFTVRKIHRDSVLLLKIGDQQEKIRLVHRTGKEQRQRKKQRQY